MLLPDKTAMFKDEECRGGKQSKVRLTLLLAANEDGSENLPPLLIGRSVRNLGAVFCPANTTTKLQPMDQGIIRSFEINYRRQFVHKLVDAIDEGSTLKINVLDSMGMTDYTWRNATQKTVQNCFKNAGFKIGCKEEKEINEKESKSIEKEAEETVDAAIEVLEINSQ
ncbi:hypothetical protein AVEN_17130-1 [Araneus ventricosus]|uniref:DDE-1 domain-containing protein n=1 Tax=Araneus ventricosus TaxID=182803 RepID=A0A4Y2WVT5_ARAVE|nr:hypothetical protein AVEN_17130-1 [Araneus ventricosus]